MALFADLLQIEISVLVKFVLAHNDLTVEDDHDLIFRRNNYQIVLLFRQNFYVFNHTLYDMARDAAKEGEHR